MWWRAQMRARQEAAREAARPLTVAHIVGILSAVGIAVALAVMLSPWVRSTMVDVAAATLRGFADVNLQTTLLANGWVLPALMISVLLLLTPLVIYFAVGEE
jgi:hypothetical protein